MAFWAVGCASAQATETAPIEVTLEDVGASGEVDDTEMDDSDEQLPPPEPAFERTGLAECDEFIATIERCSKKAPAKKRESMSEIGNKIREQAARVTDERARKMLRDACREAAESLASMC
jgi:hypothetical protein